MDEEEIEPLIQVAGKPRNFDARWRAEKMINDGVLGFLLCGNFLPALFFSEQLLGSFLGIAVSAFIYLMVPVFLLHGPLTAYLLKVYRKIERRPESAIQSQRPQADLTVSTKDHKPAGQLKEASKISEERFRELAAMGVELARKDALYNLRTRFHEHQERQLQKQQEIFQQIEKSLAREPSDLQSLTTKWELVETTDCKGPPEFSYSLTYHLLRLDGGIDMPFFELNNTFDDEASSVDLMIPELGEGTSKRQNIHTRHMYRFDEKSALEAIDEAIDQFALPELEGEARDAVSALVS